MVDRVLTLALERYEDQLAHWPKSGNTLRRFNDEWIVSIEDVSAFVTAQRGASRAKLVTPRERVYPFPR